MVIGKFDFKNTIGSKQHPQSNKDKQSRDAQTAGQVASCNTGKCAKSAKKQKKIHKDSLQMQCVNQQKPGQSVIGDNGY